AMGPWLPPLLLLWLQGVLGELELDPTGRHVWVGHSWAPSPSPPSQPAPFDHAYLAAICEGPDACEEEEVCVKPGLCRCKPGFFGAQCSSRCPGQYWGSDCRQNCPCHPNGQCDAVTGECTCNKDHWGGQCQFLCPCGLHGHCNPLTGACRCEPGWWTDSCRKACQCSSYSSGCDQLTGACQCKPGWWGRRCSFRCTCHHSACNQNTGHCICRDGWWGPECQKRCTCQHGHCNPTNGHCVCHPGYQGPLCEQACPAGRYGVQCLDSCGHCRQKEPCSPDTGTCLACEPGWNGTRCNQLCPPGTYGDNCGQLCPQCRQGEACQPASGHCQHCQGALLAGILVPLLLLLLGIVACVSCCCWAAQPDPKDRLARDGATVSRVKLQVRGALSSLGSALPCGSLSNHKLPRVTGRRGWGEGGASTVTPFTEEEFQETHQAGRPPSAPDDASAPFAIPRTSSLARAKRPSVSFAEGTKFGPQSSQGSAELASPSRKPKRLSRAAQPPAEGQEAEGLEGPERPQEPPSPAAAQGDLSGGPRRLPPGGRTVAQRVEAIESGGRGSPGPVTTIYMLAGTPGAAAGPVRAVLRRFGSFQKGRAEPKAKGSMPKPPRRALSRDKGTLGPPPAPSPASPRGLPAEAGPPVPPAEVVGGSAELSALRGSRVEGRPLPGLLTDRKDPSRAEGEAALRPEA
uniref:Scavenger receptor class F member 1 n=1 Tax=Monodelphis domestica TaxID=13616 RepID=A0A5F8HCR4_MONDO